MNFKLSTIPVAQALHRGLRAPMAFSKQPLFEGRTVPIFLSLLLLPWMTSSSLARDLPKRLIELSQATERPILWGAVQDTGGKPIAQASLRLTTNHRFHPQASAMTFMDLETDAAGRFQMVSKVKEDHVFMLIVRAPGYETYHLDTLQIDGRQLEIVLERQVQVKGRVIDRNGQPVEGARWMLSAGSLVEAVGFGYLASGKTNVDGVVDGFVRPGGVAQLRASANGWSGISEHFTISSEGVLLPDLRLTDPDIKVRLQVLGPEGSPLEGATLTLTRLSGDLQMAKNLTVSEKGLAETLEKLGRWRVKTRHPDFEPEVMEFDLTMEETLEAPANASYAAMTEVLQIRFTSRSTSPRTELKGKVVDGAGQGLAKTAIRLWGLSEGARSQFMESEPDGRWRFEVMDGAEYKLTFEHQETLPLERKIRIGEALEEIVIELEGGGVAHGAIQGLTTHQLGRLELWVESSKGRLPALADIEYQPSASYRIAGIPMEGARLKARLHYTAASRDLGELKFGDAGDELQHDLFFDPGFSVLARVTVDGEIVPDVMWKAECKGRGLASGLAVPTTATFEIHDLVPGPCVLKISGHWGYESERHFAHQQTIWVVEEGQEFHIAVETEVQTSEIVELRSSTRHRAPARNLLPNKRYQ